MAGEHLLDPVVVVLVDEDDAKRAVGLRVERGEERLEVIRPVDRGDDEVEA